MGVPDIPFHDIKQHEHTLQMDLTYALLISIKKTK